MLLHQVGFTTNAARAAPTAVAPFVVQAFDFTAAVTLIILTTAIGYVAGYFFALVWNRAHRGA